MNPVERSSPTKGSSCLAVVLLRCVSRAHVHVPYGLGQKVVILELTVFPKTSAILKFSDIPLSMSRFDIHVIDVEVLLQKRMLSSSIITKYWWHD